MNDVKDSMCLQPTNSIHHFRFLVVDRHSIVICHKHTVLLDGHPETRATSGRRVNPFVDGRYQSGEFELTEKPLPLQSGVFDPAGIISLQTSFEFGL
ncbi:hypothetical protein LshimejAT787_1801940 [Lyophyllum shimeji]|uniref:Uncharacterized protein n=1 Tax=Lyophyllum shimeji TaxID=47721 RepID=A0A9P3PXI8_LYOSH|nr:hypothetical protein LshimejAT787_1801940 [Lyophyllum shimeji]